MKKTKVSPRYKLVIVNVNNIPIASHVPVNADGSVSVDCNKLRDLLNLEVGSTMYFV